MEATTVAKTSEKVKFTSASTLANVEFGTTGAVRKISAGSQDRKFLQNKGIGVGIDLTLLGPGQGGVYVEYGCGRRELIPSELAASIYLTEPLERHLDPVISGGCCSYGNTAGALDMMDQINERTFGK